MADSSSTLTIAMVGRSAYPRRMTRTDTRTAMEIDHIGVDIWKASRAYETAMFKGIAAAGYDDLTLADSDVLAFIGPDGTRAGEIARGRSITKQAAMEQVRKLVARGYLDVGPDPEDRRARLLTLTPRGEAVMRAFAAVKQRLHQQIEAALGPEELDRLRVSLTKLREGLG